MCKTTLVRCVFFMMICMSKNQENSAWLTSISGRRPPTSSYPHLLFNIFWWFWNLSSKQVHGASIEVFKSKVGLGKKYIIKYAKKMWRKSWFIINKSYLLTISLSSNDDKSIIFFSYRTSFSILVVVWWETNNIYLFMHCSIGRSIFDKLHSRDDEAGNNKNMANGIRVFQTHTIINFSTTHHNLAIFKECMPLLLFD